MEGMARTAEQVKSQPVVQAPPALSTHSKETILPMEVYRYFNVNPITNDKIASKYLDGIYSWASKDSKTLGDTLMKIREVEQKVGQPALDEHKYTRVYNYVRMREFTDSMMEEKKKFKENAAKKYQKEQQEIEKSHKKKISEIERKKKTTLRGIEQDSKIHFKELGKLTKSYTR